jgi:hypothetical protein
MRLTSSAALLVLLAVAACGGSDNAFTADYNKAVRPIAELGGRPGTRPSHYDRLARRVRRTRLNLSRLTAPDGAADELDRLEAELGAVAKGFEDVAAATRRRDGARQLAASRALNRDIQAYERAEQALKRAVEG